METWALQDAKNRFSAVVNAALDGEPQTVTRRGAPAVVVLAVEDYERLCQAEKAGAPDFIQHLLSIPTGGPDDLLDGPSLNLRDVAW
ncbi:MAG: type II toxin-antitoxin system Phd/YefM family antitoxin [Chloroflexota bacterium]|nr:type II toxin-antitoxin system Phd/YefM family antitoxin [Chloroflexota bacterium]